ncbi:MAG: helix-turn-helix domain-containing protein [Bacilli bacterium]
MGTLNLSNQSSKINDYLFHNQPYPFSNRPYYFLVIKTADPNNEKVLINFFEELLTEACFLKINQELIVFYFEEYAFKNVILSMSDDFAISFSCFQSGKMNPAYPCYFHTLLNAFHEQISKRSFVFVDVADLILEIVKENRLLLKPLIPIILNRIENDSQYEQVIKAVLDNDLNVSKAAQSVYMHRNTLINKLDFIKSETGLNIQHFKHAFCMYWLFYYKR